MEHLDFVILFCFTSEDRTQVLGEKEQKGTEYFHF